jgi:predicted alpha/beta hydrolase
MRKHLKEKLDRSFKLTHDLVAHLDEVSLNLDLPSLPSNRIAGQLWCIVGARESYTKAIEAGGWAGFSCSLTTPRVKQSVLAALDATHKRMNEIDFADLTDVQIDLAFNLLEHEIQHHGQMIRFVYGNKLTFPDSWNKRYTV